MKPIFETGKYVCQYRSWSRLEYLLNETGRDRPKGLNDFLNIRKNLWEPNLTTCSIAFSRDPFEKKKFPTKEGVRSVDSFEEDVYNSFLDHVHAASSALVLCPDLRFSSTGMKDVSRYLDFVDYNISVLSDFNNKPVYAPMQIDLPVKKTREILEHYRKHGYRNIWLNFHASQMGSTSIARIRSLLRQVRDTLGLDQTSLMYSHIKKEIDPNMKDDKALAGDVLSQFFAADFVGVNRSPARLIDEKDLETRIAKGIASGDFANREDYEMQQRLHRSRVFSPDTYYYHKVTSYPGGLPLGKNVLMYNQDVNRLANSVLVHHEIENTKRHLIAKRKLLPYLKAKKGLIEHTEVLTSIVPPSKPRQADLLDILGKF
jgi:hypothetical protein